MVGRAHRVPRQWYCKYNGFLSVEARTAVATSFEAALEYATAVCADRAESYNITSITMTEFFKTYLRGMLSNDNQPTLEQAHHMGAWLCAMGGTDGKKGALSNGPTPDIGYCTVRRLCAWATRARVREPPARKARAVAHRVGTLGAWQYTFGDLDPEFPSEFCTYEECDGFDPEKGQLVQRYHNASNGHTPPNQTLAIDIPDFLSIVFDAL